ncbi:MAG: trypsin-like serine peptidase [Pseudonocardiaceae bacterium]
MRRAFLALLVAATGLLGAAGSAQARNVPHDNYESPSKVRSYWTAERMRSAVPRDRTNRGGAPRENAKPGGGGGKPGGASGATSVEVGTIGSTSPLTAHGKVFFTDNGVNYVCSGTALAGDVVWTAGHCVNEGPGGYYTNFLFVPAYRDGAAPYGQFPASQLLTTSGWRLGGQYGVDVGAAIPSTNAQGQSLSAAVVERSVVFDSARNQSYSAYGYPAAKPFNGRRMRVCNTAWSRDDTSANPDTMGIPCDMTGGSSGGGWVTSGGQVASVVSYGYASLRNVLFGPHLEVEAQQLYSDAQAAG